VAPTAVHFLGYMRLLSQLTISGDVTEEMFVGMWRSLGIFLSLIQKLVSLACKCIVSMALYLACS